MKYNYFIGAATVQEVKDKYKTLAKVLHPDVGGSHEKFTLMKGEYDYIVEGKSLFPIGNIVNGHNYASGGQIKNSAPPVYRNERTPEERVTNLSATEIENARIVAFFTSARRNDLSFDIIDGILETAKKEKLHKLWIYQECQKLMGLKISHFRYITWKSNDKYGTAEILNKKYNQQQV